MKNGSFKMQVTGRAATHIPTSVILFPIIHREIEIQAEYPKLGAAADLLRGNNANRRRRGQLQGSP